jgi:hypothetical protein
MSAATADFVSKTGDTIQFTFTPQNNGFAYLAGASLTVESTAAFAALTVNANQTSFKLPQNDSFIQVAIVDGPVPEKGTLAYTVNGGKSVELWSNRSLSLMPGAFFGFGN